MVLFSCNLLFCVGVFISSYYSHAQSHFCKTQFFHPVLSYAPAAVPFGGDIESGRGDIKDKKRQSSYAVKSSIHAIGVKNILIFPIHEVKHF